MSKKFLLAGAAVVLLAGAGGGYFVLTNQASAEVRAALETYKANMPQDQVFEYTDVNVSLSGATLNDVKHSWNTPGGTVTLDAEEITVSDPVSDDNDRLISLGQVTWQNAVLTDSDGVRVTAASGSAADVTQPDALDDGQLPLSALSFSDLTVTREGETDRLTIASFEGSGFADRVIEDARLSDLSLRTEAPMRIGEITATNIDLTEFAKLGSNPEPNAVIEALSARSAGTITMNDLMVTDPRGATPTDVTLDTLKLQHQASGKGDIRLSIDTRGWGMPVKPHHDLAEFDIDQVRGDFAAVYSFDPSTQRLAIRDVSLGIDGMGTLSGAIHFADVPDPRTARRNPNRSFEKMSLSEASLSWADDGLMDLAYDQMAREQNTDVASLKRTISAQLSRTLDAETADPLTNFMQRGGTIEITAKPDRPVPLQNLMIAAMMRPQALRAGLNLEIVSR